MNIARTSLFAMALASVISARAAETITFRPGAELEEYITEQKTSKLLSLQEVDGEGVITFETEGGGSLALLHPGKEILSKAEEIEVTFRMRGNVNFGVFVREGGFDTPAYMAFVVLSEKSGIRLSLIKSNVTHRQELGEAVLGANGSKNFLPDAWYTLKLRLKDTGADSVHMSGEILEAGTQSSVVEVSAEDPSGAIMNPGGIAFRYFGGRGLGGGAVQVKSVSFSP